MTSESEPFVSVIIPHYNDAGRLAHCLAALEAQTYPRARFEVIVIDNGSPDGVAEVAARFPRARFLEEATPGSYAARNTGLQAAAGEVVAFTDADCVPDRDWLAQGVAVLRRVDRCGLVGGAIRLIFHTPNRPTLGELYDSIFDFDQERFIAHGKFACTANLFTYMDVARRVGAFDGRLKSVGDRDLGNRIAAAGYRLVFAERAVVSHPARRTVHELLQKRRRVAGGHHARARKRSWPRLRFVHAVGRYVVWNPFSGAARIQQKARRVSRAVKLKVLGLYVFLCYAEVLELVRLQLGAESRR